MNNPLLDYVNKAARVSADITEYYQECTLRYLKAMNDVLDGTLAPREKSSADIEREVRAEWLAKGRAVPK